MRHQCASGDVCYLCLQWIDRLLFESGLRCLMVTRIPPWSRTQYLLTLEQLRRFRRQCSSLEGILGGYTELLNIDIFNDLVTIEESIENIYQNLISHGARITGRDTGEITLDMFGSDL